MLAERSINSTTSRSLPIVSGALRYGRREQKGKQEHAGNPQGQEDPASNPSAPSLIAEHYPQEVKRADSNPCPLSKEQVDHDRHGHRRSGRQESQMDEAQASQMNGPRDADQIRPNQIGSIELGSSRQIVVERSARAVGRWSS